jgi:DNA-binding NtrC family response regulator
MRREIDTEIPTVLSVSPVKGDHATLRQILTRSKLATLRFKVEVSATLASAMVVMENSRVPIVLVERDLSPGSWTDLLEHSVQLPLPPLLIVCSRLADEWLWAEALNLGAWDVLAKPFDVPEVCHVLETAWHHWSHRHGSRWVSASESKYRATTRSGTPVCGSERANAFGR